MTSPPGAHRQLEIAFSNIRQEICIRNVNNLRRIVAPIELRGGTIRYYRCLFYFLMID